MGTNNETYESDSDNVMITFGYDSETQSSNPPPADPCCTVSSLSSSRGELSVAINQQPAHHDNVEVALNFVLLTNFKQKTCSDPASAVLQDFSFST